MTLLPMICNKVLIFERTLVRRKILMALESCIRTFDKEKRVYDVMVKKLSSTVILVKEL